MYLMYDFEIERKTLTVFKTDFETTKWLNFQDWLKIYENLSNITTKIQSENLSEIEKFKDFCHFNDNIVMTVESYPLEKYHKKIYADKKFQSLSFFLKISIKTDKCVEKKEIATNTVEINEAIETIAKIKDDYYRSEELTDKKNSQTPSLPISFLSEKIRKKRRRQNEEIRNSTSRYVEKRNRTSPRHSSTSKTAEYEPFLVGATEKSENNSTYVVPTYKPSTKSISEEKVADLEQYSPKPIDKMIEESSQETVVDVSPIYKPSTIVKKIESDANQSVSSDETNHCKEELLPPSSEIYPIKPNRKVDKLRPRSDLFGDTDDEEINVSETHTKSSKKAKTEKPPEKFLTPERKSSRTLTSIKSSIKKKESEHKSTTLSNWLSKSDIKDPKSMRKTKDSTASNKNKDGKSQSTDAGKTKTDKISDIVEKYSIKNVSNKQLFTDKQQKSLLEQAKKLKRETDLEAIFDKQRNLMGFNEKPAVVKNVKILKMHQVPPEELVATFDDYKGMIDTLFNDYNNYKLKHNREPLNLNGMSDTFQRVGNILNDKQMFQLMLKLAEVYEESESFGLYTSLFTNVLVPEWALRIYVSKYNFSDREAALRHIRLQEEYELANMSVSDFM